MSTNDNNSLPMQAGLDAVAGQGKPRFTPGPWHRNIPPASKYCTIFAGRNTRVAQLSTQGLSETAIEGNCDLISAAPDLFEALAELIRCVRGGDDTAGVSMDDALIDADQALAKARGES